MLEKWKKEIKDTIYGSKLFQTEIHPSISAACSLIHIYDREVYIYGGGDDTYTLIRFLQSEGIHVKNIIDINEKLCGQSMSGVEIIIPSKLTNVDRDKSFIFITTASFGGMEQSDIVNVLNEMGFRNFLWIGGEERKFLTQKLASFDEGRYRYYVNNIDKIYEVLELLAHDEESMYLLNEFLKVFFENKVFLEKNSSFRYKYFYGEGYSLEKKVENLYIHLEQEVWINCGACEGENILTYFQNGFNGKRILAYEGDKSPVLQRKLKANIERLPDNMKKIVDIVPEFITNETDFTKILQKDEKVTLLNADIEGAEMELLKSCSKIIKEHRPVLAVCIYHRPEDLVEIPKYINSLVSDYVFYIRKYVASPMHWRRYGELVFYAIPSERHDHRWIDV